MRPAPAGEPGSSLEELAHALRCLPGVGPKAAQRMALHLLQHDRDGAKRLAGALDAAATLVRHCERCNTFTEEAVCALCRSPRRDPGLLCVVGYRLIELKTLAHLVRESKLEGLAFVFAAVGTVTGHLMTGLAVGLALSLGRQYFVKRSETARAEAEGPEEKLVRAVLHTRRERGGRPAPRVQGVSYRSPLP